jgi:PIN domain nuclease of toxin-antitoxin system
MIVLDTHTLVWWVNGDVALSNTAKTAIEAAGQTEGGIVVSSITAWEITMLVQRERLWLTMDVTQWLATVAMIPAVRFVAVDVAIAVQSANLPGEFHNDPADRIIVATSRKLGRALVSKDEKIRAYPHVKTIW